MSVDQRLLLAQDLDLLANQRTLFVEQCFSLAERALWLQEVLRLCEVTQHHLPPNADGIVSEIRWGLDVYAMREERALTKAQRLPRPEEHTSELQSLMRRSYDVFGVTKQTNRQRIRSSGAQ